MRTLIVVLFSLFLSVSLYPKSISELLDVLKNQSASMKYVYFIANDNAFLATPKDDTYSVWLYTANRKWKPISSAISFDLFNGADKIFDNISVDKVNEKITFGSIISNNALSDSKILENKTFKIIWYFWTKDKESFLFRKRGDSGISIWNYTSDRKWKPLYNASAFDNFPQRPKTFENVEFNPSLSRLKVGNINPYYNLRLNKILPGMEDDTSNKVSFNAKVFYENKCASCHGINGQGGYTKSLKNKSSSIHFRNLKPYQTGNKTSPAIMSDLLINFDIGNLKSLADYMATFSGSYVNEKNKDDDRYGNDKDNDRYDKDDDDDRYGNDKDDDDDDRYGNDKDDDDDDRYDYY